jgi:hypothetical protein
MLSMNPEVIWKWALEHNFDLTLKGYLIVKDTNTFIDSVLSNGEFI